MKNHIIISSFGFAICAATSLCQAQTLSKAGGGASQKPVFVRTTNRATVARSNGFAAEVTSPSFKVHSPNRGLWKGFVRGNGTIHLTLQIIRNGIVESSRYIGNVAQIYSEKPTSFFYTGPLPKGSDWSWTIVAR